MTALVELKTLVEKNTQALQVYHAAIAVGDVKDLPSDVQIPVKTLRELQILEDKLSDDETFAKTLVSSRLLFIFLSGCM